MPTTRTKEYPRFILPEQRTEQSLADMMRQFPNNASGDILLDLNNIPAGIQGDFETACYRYMLHIISKKIHQGDTQKILNRKGIDGHELIQDIAQSIWIQLIETPLCIGSDRVQNSKELTGTLGVTITRKMSRYLKYAPNEKLPRTGRTYRGVEARDIHVDQDINKPTETLPCYLSTPDATNPEIPADPETLFFEREKPLVIPARIETALEKIQLKNRVVFCLYHQYYPPAFDTWFTNLIQQQQDDGHIRAEEISLKEAQERLNQKRTAKTAMTLEDIAHILGMTKERSYQIQRITIQQLKKHLQFDEDVHNYLYS